MSKLRTIFMGTPEFAVPCAKKLTEISDVIAVVTQPDQRSGRGQKFTATPVKKFAQEKGIPVYQPIKVKADDFVPILEALKPDLIVVVAFGQILSQRILDIPKYGCINVHASLLPRYRGAAPMQWCLINGEKETGVTTMFMNAGLDTGDMLQKSVVEITPDMNLETLHDALSEKGAELLASTVQALQEGTLERTPQDDSLSNYAPMITKETGRIDWKKSAQEIHNLVRGLDSWPGAYTTLDGKMFKIWRTRCAEASVDAAPGEVVNLTKKGFMIGTGDGVLEILELQAPGKKRMSAANFVCGHSLDEHTRFDVLD